MENKNNLYIIIFVAILAIVGGIYIFATKKPTDNQPLATAIPSATIEPSAEPVATSSANPKMENKLIIVDEVIGTGAEAISGKKITVNYSGTLIDGTKFDSSYDRGTPFPFNLGAGEVIKGWDLGVLGMKEGEKRQLVIPAGLAYGSDGFGNIPPGATLIFRVDLISINEQ